MIHYFNPGHEVAVFNASPYYMAPSNVVAMQRELSFLPIWYASDKDAVLVSADSSSDYYEFIKNNFSNLPSAVFGSKGLTAYINETIIPWGISPQVIHFWEKTSRELQLDLHIPIWHNEYTYLNSRESGRDCLCTLIREIPEISSTIIPQFYTSLQDIENTVLSTKDQLLVKAPYSSSGRGLLWLPIGELTRTERQILHGVLKKQGTVSVEKALDKQLDFAMEFMTDGQGKTEFIGYSLFKTNGKGAYEGNCLATQDYIENKIGEVIPLTLLETVKCKLKSILSEKYASIYKGCIGVDMMAYLENEDTLLHPCVEINMRYNMGYLALMFSKMYLYENTKGYFYLDFSTKDGEIFSRHQQMQMEHLAVFERGKLRSGYLPLCPVSTESHYWAYVLIK